MPSKNKVHISKDSPNAGTGGSLVLYSYKEKHERHRKNIIKKEVRKMFDKNTKRDCYFVHFVI